MEYDGMVHALEEIHRLLKPAGVLVDIHPVSVPSPLEIHHGGKIEFVGDLSVRQWCFEFQQADEALTEIIRRGVFALEREFVFDSLTHYGSVSELRRSTKDALEKYARDEQAAVEDLPQVEALAVGAERRMHAAPAGAELIVREPTHISRLRPI